MSAIRPGNTGQPPPGTKSQNSKPPPPATRQCTSGEQGPVPFLPAEKQNPPPKHVRKTLGQPSGIGTREQAKGGPTNPGTHGDPTNSTTASADHPLTTKAGALHAPKAVRPPRGRFGTGYGTGSWGPVHNTPEDQPPGASKTAKRNVQENKKLSTFSTNGRTQDFRTRTFLRSAL